jgi:hypothetical protein
VCPRCVSRSSHGPGSNVAKLSEPIQLLATKIHGLFRLPEGYELRQVQKDATFEHDDDRSNEHYWTSFVRIQSTSRTAICCDYNIMKILISIAQMAFAISTLYRTRGDQISQYGYAAFGLTVTPYAFMSLVNFVGNLICPQYGAMFIVESTDLDELRERIKNAGQAAQERFTVNGTVGRLSAASDASMSRDVASVVQDETFSLKPLLLNYLVGSVVPLAVVGILSGFAPR